MAENDFENAMMLQLFTDDCDMFRTLPYIVDELCCHTNPILRDLVYRRDADKIPRNHTNIENIVATYTDLQFKEHFRMNRFTFEALLTTTGNYFGKEIEKIYVHIPLSNKLLFTIWLLSTNESFLAVGKRFDIPVSSGHGIFMAVVDAFSKMMGNFVQWPCTEQHAVSAEIFEIRSNGFPNVIGAIGCCHIPIKQPVINGDTFLNRKNRHSIILQGVCDHNDRFLNVFIGMPGRSDEARVFQQSKLSKLLSDSGNPLLSPDYHIIGDKAYPLMINVMIPFRDDDDNLSNGQTHYNRAIYSILPVIDQAFARLNAKFLRLKYLDVADIETANVIIAAACMLHNFIIENGESDDDDALKVEINDREYVNMDPDANEPPSASPNKAEEKRNGIVNLLIVEE